MPAPITTPAEVARLLREYGAAFRYDWSDVDGRGVRQEMDTVAGWLDEPGTFPGIERARGWLGVCPAGRGHWTWHCTDDCEATEDGDHHD